MTQAADFTRDDCQFGKRRLSYEKATREYCCDDCTGRIVMLGSHDDPRYPDNWRVACVVCGSHNFIREYELRKQKSEAVEVFVGLPQEMQDLLQPEQVLPKRPPGVFSLSPPEPIEL